MGPTPHRLAAIDQPRTQGPQPQLLQRQIWKPALITNDVPPTRDNGCHALRHFYASVLLDGGESIKTVSQRLGHADPAFTLRTYTHLMPDSRSRTQSIIDASLRGKQPPTSVCRRAPNVPPQAR